MGRVQRLSERIPNMIIRTSVIVGFPGETDEDFQALLEGVKAKAGLIGYSSLP